MNRLLIAGIYNVILNARDLKITEHRDVPCENTHCHFSRTQNPFNNMYALSDG